MGNYKDSTDEDLVVLYKDGDEKAFEVLYSRFEQKLKRLIYHYIPDEEEVSDVFHEVIIRVIKHIHGFNIKKSFSSWIYQIAINCSKNYIGSSRKNKELLEKEKFRIMASSINQLSPEEIAINDFDMREFNNAIENMKEKFRDVFMLRYDLKMKYSDISDLLSCSERAAKWRMERAVEYIIQYLKENKVI